MLRLFPSIDVQYDKTVTTYKCPKIKCSCIPDRMLCGKDGSVSEYNCLKLLYIEVLLTVVSMLMLSADFF